MALGCEINVLYIYEIVGKCVNKLEHVELAHTPPYKHFSFEELITPNILRIPSRSIFERMEIISNLTSLSLHHLDFTEVKPGTLASCLNKLEDITFGGCRSGR